MIVMWMAVSLTDALHEAKEMLILTTSLFWGVVSKVSSHFLAPPQSSATLSSQSTFLCLEGQWLPYNPHLLANYFPLFDSFCRCHFLWEVLLDYPFFCPTYRHCCSEAELWLTLYDHLDGSTLGFPVFLCLLEFAQAHVSRVGDAIQPSHPLLFSSFAFSLSQHQAFTLEATAPLPPSSHPPVPWGQGLCFIYFASPATSQALENGCPARACRVEPPSCPFCSRLSFPGQALPPHEPKVRLRRNN